MNSIRDLDEVQLRALASLTKYPSIETFHSMGERGRLTEEHSLPRSEVIVTEKVDGTNAGIVFLGDEFLIRSREEWLTYSGDVIRNPQMGIVETLLPLGQRIAAERPDDGAVIVLFGEVYGGNVGASARNYSSRGARGFRLFDVIRYEPGFLATHLERPIDEIAAWREAGGQVFADEHVLTALASDWNLPIVPRVAKWELSGSQPIAAMYERLASAIDLTGCSLDGTAGRAEGLVLRTRDRLWIRKVRFEDYRRTLGRKP